MFWKKPKIIQGSQFEANQSETEIMRLLDIAGKYSKSLSDNYRVENGLDDMYYTALRLVNKVRYSYTKQLFSYKKHEPTNYMFYLFLDKIPVIIDALTIYLYKEDNPNVVLITQIKEHLERARMLFLRDSEEEAVARFKKEYAKLATTDYYQDDLFDKLKQAIATFRDTADTEYKFVQANQGFLKAKTHKFFIELDEARVIASLIVPDDYEEDVLAKLYKDAFMDIVPAMDFYLDTLRLTAQTKKSLGAYANQLEATINSMKVVEQFGDYDIARATRLARGHIEKALTIFKNNFLKEENND